MTQTSSSQSFVMHPLPEARSRAVLRFVRQRTEGSKWTFLSGTYELRFDIDSGDDLNFQAAIPYSIVKYEGYGDIHTNLGNIYAGVAHCLSRRGNATSALLYGVYVPTLDECFVSGRSHFQEPPIYLSQTISLAMSYRYHRTTPGGFVYGLDLGPDLVLPKNGDPEIIAHYGFSGGLLVRDVVLLTEFYGIMWLDPNLRDLSDEFWNHSITLGAEFRSGSFRPAVFCQMPLEQQLRDWFDAILGIQCELIFG
jgi:hypothetical protein